MIISLNFISKFTDLKLPREELLSRIGSRLAEVDSATELAPKYEGIMVAEITKAADHPDADRLGVYDIDYGKARTTLVAGDKTLKAGDKVAYIPPGSVVPSTFATDEPFMIKKVNLRGVESDGMLASGAELDFSDEDKSVLVLDTEVKPGTTLIEAYELDDVIIEVENKTLTHRPDTFGLIGFARELAGISDVRFKSPDWWLDDQEIAKSTRLKLEVDNRTKDGAPAYFAVAMSNVRIGPSPILIQTYLTRLGLRPINNVVDVTNYLMVMTGQPLHAFDYDKLPEGKIIIRRAKHNEEITLLDGKQVKLDAEDVIICDINGPTAIGGVMGGGDSEVSQSTTNIIIESANFDMYSIRTTSMRHGIFTDAVTRFSRGQSPQLSRKVLVQAMEMMSQVAGAKVASPIVGSAAKFNERKIDFTAEKISQLLGKDYDVKAITDKLSCVELDVMKDGKKLTLSPPWWRNDLNIVEDVAEEVGRLFGFDEITPTLPARDLTPTASKPFASFKRQIRLILSSAGANEALTYSAVSSRVIKSVGWEEKDLIRIRNARSPEFEYMRPALLPSLATKVHINHKNTHDEFALYSINVVHNQLDIDKEGKLPAESSRLALVYSGLSSETSSAYYRARHYLDYLLDEIGLDKIEYLPLSEAEPSPSWKKTVNKAFYEPRAAAVTVNGNLIGVIGEFSSGLAAAFKLPDSCAGFEIDLDVISDVDLRKSYQPLNRFPKVQRDVTYEISDETSFADVRLVIEERLENLDRHGYELRPVDVYRGKGDRRVTFSLALWHEDKTLTSDEANKVIDELSDTLKKQLSAKLI